MPPSASHTSRSPEALGDPPRPAMAGRGDDASRPGRGDPRVAPAVGAPADPRGARPVAPATGDRRGATLEEVVFTAGVWHDRQQVNATATLEHCLDWMERLGWIANFDRVATGDTLARRPGWVFADSEVYKLMEALAWEVGRTGDAWAEKTLVTLTDRVAAAQDHDGYLHTAFGHAGRPPRWSDLESGHELYCLGHLMQAAVARARTRPVDRLVEVARRAADLVHREFGPDGRDDVGGHPEIELGLVELGRALDVPDWVDQAALFVQRRGHGRLQPIRLLGADYFQDDVPVREAVAFRGHAVRALYLAAAAVDIAVDLGDDDLLAALERQWQHTVARRTHLTGGMGSRHQDEGFGQDWELPPDRAYCETCAGIASVMLAWRLYLATGEVRYADLVERTMFNVVATSPRADGRAFFYANPLHQREVGVDGGDDEVSPMAEAGTRAPWFDVSCCPTNVARTLASWSAYAVAVDQGRVAILQYAAMDVEVELDDGERGGLSVRTDYPADGRVEVTVTHGPDRGSGLRLRIPAWGVGAEVEVDGATEVVEPGWYDVDGLTPGACVVLHLPVGPRITRPDPRIDALRGCLAVEAGPLVLCLESTDLPDDVDLADVRLDPDVALRRAGDVVHVGARLAASNGERSWPYVDTTDARSTEDRDTTPDATLVLPLVPYHRWAERAPSAMRVWLPTT